MRGCAVPQKWSLSEMWLEIDDPIKFGQKTKTPSKKIFSCLRRRRKFIQKAPFCQEEYFICRSLWDSIWQRLLSSNGSEESKQAEKREDSKWNILKQGNSTDSQLRRKNQKSKMGFRKKRFTQAENRTKNAVFFSRWDGCGIERPFVKFPWQFLRDHRSLNLSQGAV